MSGLGEGSLSVRSMTHNGYGLAKGKIGNQKVLLEWIINSFDASGLKISYNVRIGLCDVVAFKAQKFNNPPKLNRITNDE